MPPKGSRKAQRPALSGQSTPAKSLESSDRASRSSTPPSTPAASNDDPTVSAHMRDEEARLAATSAQHDDERQERFAQQRQEDRASGQEGLDTKFKALEYLLSQSKLYSTIMLSQMQKQEERDEKRDEKAKRRASKQEALAEKCAIDSQRKSSRQGAQARAKTNATSADRAESSSAKTPVDRKDSGIGRYFPKRHVEEKAETATVQEALEVEAALANTDGVNASDIGVQSLQSARQPDLVTGGVMRKYQLEGLEWLASLYENGLNGILADEMGLGKTVQVIAFLAFLREKGTYGPFLIAAPLSTTGNWINEFRRWTPDIPAVLYHGSKEEREDLRRNKLKNPRSKDFPVICTSYEICMNDRKHLAHYGWKFVIIDEGHRIKNLNCRLIRELQSYQSANRLLITGTPLQNNLSELWSLLHFLMPEIFDKLESFESWFDFSALKDKNGYQQILSEDRKKNLVTSLHAILKPFLLRRVKADVEHKLPKKREYVLYAPLSRDQLDLYQAILNGNGRAHLEHVVYTNLRRSANGSSTPKKSSNRDSKRKRDDRLSTPGKSAKTSRSSTPTAQSSTRERRARPSGNYGEVSDAEFFRKLGSESVNSDAGNPRRTQDDGEVLNNHQRALALAKRHIAQKKLQNPVLQLRLVCNSVDLFFDRFAIADGTEGIVPAPDYTALVTSSGKMQILESLLKALFKDADHKVLIFSQFKTQLDLLALYLTEVLGLHVCRIDGAVPQNERQEAIDLFNTDKNHRVFLLSTRAGGQGINLAAADTVVLFDSDWNPQQDLQAQDRAHRIGQQRNVIVYRLATRGTVEEMLLEKAEGKRRLEKLVIQKGKFKGWGEKKKIDSGADEGLEELRSLLSRSDGEMLDFQAGTWLTEEELRILTDRSDEAYERAEREESSGRLFKAVETRKGEGLLEAMSK